MIPVTEYNRKLIDKGYNAKKRKELCKIYKDKYSHKKKQRKHANPWKLTDHNWIDKYPLSKLTKYNAQGHLKLFYPWPMWNEWHRYVKFITINPRFASFHTQDGCIYTNSTILAKKLNISYEQMMIHIIESKLNQYTQLKNRWPTYSTHVNQSQMYDTLWFDINQLKLFNKLKIFYNYDMQWLELYDNALDAQEYIDTHFWATTHNGSLITGQGQLKNAIHTIAKAEYHNQQPVSANIKHNVVWIHGEPVLIQPWQKLNTYYPRRKYLLFEGSC